MSTNFLVNGGKIKSPAHYQIGFSPMATDSTGRLLSGDMKYTALNRKLEVTLTYDAEGKGISDADLLVILGGTWDNFTAGSSISYEFTFPFVGGVQKTIKAYFAPFTIERSKEDLYKNRWSNFTFKFIEL